MDRLKKVKKPETVENIESIESIEEYYKENINFYLENENEDINLFCGRLLQRIDSYIKPRKDFTDGTYTLIIISNKNALKAKLLTSCIFSNMKEGYFNYKKELLVQTNTNFKFYIEWNAEIKKIGIEAAIIELGETPKEVEGTPDV